MDAALAAALAAGAPVTLPDDAAPFWDGVVPTDWSGWVALGARVFSDMPGVYQGRADS